MYMFDRVGRVQVTVPRTEDRDSRIEAILEAASSAGGEDFEMLEDSTIVEVRNLVHSISRRAMTDVNYTTVLLSCGVIRSDDQGHLGSIGRGRHCI